MNDLKETDIKMADNHTNSAEYKAVPLKDGDPEKDNNKEAETDNVELKPKMTLLNGCTVIVG